MVRETKFYKWQHIKSQNIQVRFSKIEKLNLKISSFDLLINDMSSRFLFIFFEFSQTFYGQFEMFPVMLHWFESSCPVVCLKSFYEI